MRESALLKTLKILFSTFGSLGDIHPYVAIALEAKRRGHTPVIATSERYREKIAAQNIEFRPVAPDLPPEDEFAGLAKQVMNEKDGPRFLFEEILGPSIRTQYADLLAASEDVDLLISHPAAQTGPLVARKTGKKWLSSVLSPISLWSRRDPCVPPTLPHLDWLRVLGPLWGRIQVEAGKAATKKWVVGIEQLREEQNIEFAGHPMFGGQFSPFGTLALFSRHFCAPQPDWPQNTTATGFCFYDAVGLKSNSQPESSDWRAWMQNGSPPVVIGLGSAAVHDGAAIWDAAVRASRRDNVRVVLLTAGTFETAEENVLCVPYAPYSEIFPLARHVYHQGGVGTTAQALRAGVRQVIMPFAHDQSDNAARIQRLGVGRWMRRRELPSLNLKMTRSAWELQRFERAREIGELIRAENGPQAACESIERVGAM
ncbi:O-mycaminosyltylonolide 6-deoxyallosyltransferase [Abditibacteriota bacterium]|nr:O-mycaminosyltylonolide 6-deoxyallosyltransferase [Abditibacteriota bacterium]